MTSGADARRAALLALVRDSVQDASSIDTRTPLISSGLLDSVGLFGVICWVEEQRESEVDATLIDFAIEWDTIEQILEFVDRSSSTAAAPPVAGGPYVSTPDRNG